MSSSSVEDRDGGYGSGDGSGSAPSSSASSTVEKYKEKVRVSRMSLVHWHTHQNDVNVVKTLLEEDRSLVSARDYDSRTPLHVASLHGWIDVAKCLIDFGADINALDRWKNTPLDDAEGAKKRVMMDYLRFHGGKSFGQSGSHSEAKPIPPPLPNQCNWETEPSEIDFSSATIIGKGSFGEIIRARWRGTPVAVKRILPNLCDDRLVIQDFRHEVNLLVKLRHPNVVQFLGAVTEKKPLMLIIEYLRGGDLHQYLREKGSLSPSIAVNFALDIARGMAYLHNEPNVIVHRDLKPRNVLLVNSNADHLKVSDFGLSKLIKAQNSHDVYKMTGETGSYRYMAPEVFKHRKYDKKMLEGDPPLLSYEPYEAAKHVAEGIRPTFHSKGYLPELRELTDNCWAADNNKRPSFLEILKRLEKIKENLPAEHHWGNIF
ncbi:putative Protein kinase [Zostera marina]|uniref:Protein kinase domain-containing protein n=1 Tax=Zostera marina TaxID=29655 RepID=A0A0K9Q3A4_ZOSMR|nr:putative Protein kinase [Zostera marina]